MSLSAYHKKDYGAIGHLVKWDKQTQTNPNVARPSWPCCHGLQARDTLPAAPFNLTARVTKSLTKRCTLSAIRYLRARAQNVLFMQSKPNVKSRKINLSDYIRRSYVVFGHLVQRDKQTQTNPIFNLPLGWQPQSRRAGVGDGKSRYLGVVYRGFTWGVRLYALRCPLNSTPCRPRGLLMIKSVRNILAPSCVLRANIVQNRTLLT
jgi:hypothetical protein